MDVRRKSVRLAPSTGTPAVGSEPQSRRPGYWERGKPIGALLLILILSVTSPAQSTQPSTAPATEPAKEKISSTHHQIAINGTTLSYTAVAGDMVMKDESGKPKADMFFVSYQLDGQSDPARRPLMFLFNGGPGAAAVWLHLGAAGPQTIAMGPDDLPIGPPYHLSDNSSTWLATADLVFIDPVSTGYSRPAPGESADQFHGLNEDIASVADFIRLYLTKYRRWASPIYLAGESYGTTRAAALAYELAEVQGVAVNGVILVSSVLDFETLSDNDLTYALYLPSYTAVAWYHKKLTPELQADFNKAIDRARAFTLEQYIFALTSGAALTPQQHDHIVQQVSFFTGLPADLIERGNLAR